MIFQGRNRGKAIQHDKLYAESVIVFWILSLELSCRHHPEIEELHKNGVHAVTLDESNFDSYLSENPYVFVNFFAHGVYGVSGLSRRGKLWLKRWNV